MIEKNLFATVALLAMILISVSADAQYNDLRLLQKDVPNTWQPSSAPEAGWYLSMPALGSFNLEAHHSGFAYSEVVTEDDSLDVDAVFNELQTVNSLFYRLDHQILQFGFRVGKLYFKAGLSEHSNFRFDYPENLLRLAWEGNGSSTFLGKTVSMSDMAVNSLTYTDFTVGFSMPIRDDRFRIGANLHYLNGLVAVKTSRSDLSLYTDAETYNLRLNGQFEMYTAGFSDANKYDSFEFDFDNFKPLSQNHGFAVDMGIEGKVTDNIYATFLINDFGFINWKERTYNYKSGADFDFKGLPLNSLVSEENQNEEYFENYVDSLRDDLKVEEFAGSFNTALNTQIAFTAGYRFNKHHELGLSGSYLRLFTSDIITPGAYYRLSIRNFAGAFTQATLYDLRHFNANAGFWLRGGPVMFHVGVANIPAAINPSYHRNFGFSFGLNSLFNRDKKQDTQESAS